MNPFITYKRLVRIWLDSELDEDVEKMVDTMYAGGLISHNCYRCFKDRTKELVFGEKENSVVNAYTGEVMYKRDKYGKLVEE